MSFQMYAVLDMTYEMFVKAYLGKRDPDTGMWWRLDAMAEKTGTDLDTLIAYCRRAQRVNFDLFTATGKNATEKQLLEG